MKIKQFSPLVPWPTPNVFACSARLSWLAWAVSRPSFLADQLGIARNTLSFHLKELSHAGLVSIEQQGRNLIYRADFSQMNGLLGYLTEHCCQGAPCEASDPGACTAC